VWNPPGAGNTVRAGGVLAVPRDRLEALRGRTAVVTGASSGIGAEFTRQLAAAGLAVVAVARRAELLEALAADRRRVGEVLERPEVAMLVDNAGVSSHGELVQTSPAQAEAMVAVNVTAMAALSKRAADAFAGRVGRWLERSYFMDPADRVEKALAGFCQGRATVVVDPVDRAVVRLPRRVIRWLDGWALRQLTGS
jgi:NAD(P)-dependent dehydrogenase (short-subunit alcohol dehydrogenase family)